MSGIRVKGFFKDIGGINRIVDARKQMESSGSDVPERTDWVRELADELHPAAMRVKVVSIRESSPTTRTFRFESENGKVPCFQCCQYVNFRFRTGNSLVTRPYTISSAPYEAVTGEGNEGRPFFEVTIRRNVSMLGPDFFFDQVKEGDVLDANMPFGTFYWEPLRDSKNVIALAGGVGITPFASMAKEIAFGALKGVKLTILYGSNTLDDIAMKDELDRLEAGCPEIRVIHVLANEPGWKGEKGFINRQIIEKYMGEDPTFMFCGPLPMFQAVEHVLMDEMKVPFRRFRHDVVGQPKDVTKLKGYPAGTEKNRFKITVVRGIQEDVIDADASEPVAVALERAAIPVDTHCRGGECGFCRSQLLEGEIFVSPLGDGRRMMDKEMGWFHPCSAWPLSDLKVKIPIL